MIVFCLFKKEIEMANSSKKSTFTFSEILFLLNPNELYVLVSSALPTTRRDMTCTVLKAT